jgi:chromosome segregation ATPase
MDDKTQGLPDMRSFEERVFARFDAMDARFDSMETRFDSMETRLTALEEKVDARLRETRPIWESMQQQLTTLDARMAAMEARMTAMEKTLDLIRVGMGELYGDSIEVRARIALLENRARTPAG